MKLQMRNVLVFAAALTVFSAGYAAGVNRFGMPKTLIHVVIIQWKPTTSAAERQKVIDGVRQMALEIPGIENIWIKPVRVASMKWNTAFAIEFSSAAAAARYANNPVHAAWSKLEQAAREDSLNVQISN
jgi:hypothetical protein